MYEAYLLLSDTACTAGRQASTAHSNIAESESVAEKVFEKLGCSRRLMATEHTISLYVPLQKDATLYECISD